MVASEYLFKNNFGVAVLDKNGQFISANSLIHNFFEKIEPGININKYNILNFISQKDKLKLKNYFEGSVNLNEEVYFELTVKSGTGNIKKLIMYSFKLPFNETEYFFNCTFVNRENDKYFEMNRNIPIGMATVSISDKFNVLHANEEFYCLFGISSENKEMLENFNLLEKDEFYIIKSEIFEQLENSNKVMVEFRARRTDGALIWLHMRAKREVNEENINVFYGVFLDVTSRKNTELALEREKERYRIIVESTGDVIFEYHIKNDLMILNEKIKDKDKSVNYRMEISNYLKCIRDRFLVHEEDADIMKSICMGQRCEQSELRLGRLRGEKGSFCWYSINSSVIFDEEGSPIQTIGALRNIDEIKKSEQRLKETAEHDPMTDLYNKVVAERLIRNSLSSFSNECISAFIIVDIDDFKNINDTMGHMYGDIVIKEISSRIKRTFRASDIVGRVGGDEFLIFMANAGSLEKVGNKAQMLVEGCNLIFRGTRKKINVSVSIGIAICNEYENDYEKIYVAADMALYKAKHNGKGCFYIAHKEK